MIEITPVGGGRGGECFLFASDQTAVLVDAGFDFCARQTIDQLRAALRGRALHCILASHSHYDHIGGAPAIKQCFPDAIVVGSSHAREVAAKPSAKALMRSLNAECAREAGVHDYPDRINDLAIDLAVEDGDVLTLPGITIRAMASPGHTRCAMSYYFPEENLLACSETFGICPRYPDVIPCFIVGYQSTLDAIDQALALRPARLFLSHTGLVPDGEAVPFLHAARQAAEKAASMLLDLHDRNRGRAAIIDAFKREYYYPAADLQPERAFMLNTEAMIPRILAEFGRAEPA